MDFFSLIIHVVLVLLILLLIYRVASKEDKYWLTGAAILKVVAGISLGYVYLQFFKGGDSVRYFEEAARLAESTKVNFWQVLIGDFNPNGSGFSNQPRALFFLKIVYVLFRFTSGNFWLIGAYLSLISFFGALYFYRALVGIFNIEKRVFLIVLFFWPSIVFWSSGIIKESISLTAIYVIVGSILKLLYLKNQFILNILLFIIGTLVLFKLKYYYAAVLIPLLFSFAISHVVSNSLKNAKPYLSYLIFFFLIGIGALVSMQIHPNLDIERIVKVMVDNYHLFESKSEPDKMVHFESLSPHFLDLIYYSPKALFAGLFRPFLFDIENFWSAIAAVENVVLFILCVAQLKNIKRAGNLLVLTIILYCLIMAVFLSFSAPNFGTLVRYKVGFLPFFVLLILIESPLLAKIKKSGFLKTRTSMKY